MENVWKTPDEQPTYEEKIIVLTPDGFYDYGYLNYFYKLVLTDSCWNWDDIKKWTYLDELAKAGHIVDELVKQNKN